jgi:pteridine reductase
MTMKTALITGAAKRIGAKIARDLHADGIDIVIHYHTSRVEAEQLAAELNDIRNNSAISVSADLRDIESFNKLQHSVAEFTDNLDVLVNNASMFYPTPIEKTTPQHWMDIVGTNMKAPYFLVQELLPYLKKARGCVINITDIYGEMPMAGHPVYCTSKAGLLMLTRSLALELAPEVRVNAISPGAILWPEGVEKGHKNEVTNRTLLGRAGTASDISSTVRFLIDSEFITAQVINVDGGRLY